MKTRDAYASKKINTKNSGHLSLLCWSHATSLGPTFVGLLQQSTKYLRQKEEDPLQNYSTVCYEQDYRVTTGHKQLLQVKSKPILPIPKWKISEEAKTVIANPKVRKMGNETHSSCCKAQIITAKPQKPEDESKTHGKRGKN